MTCADHQGAARNMVVSATRQWQRAAVEIGNLENYYHFYHSKTFKRSTLSSRGPHTFLRMDPQVKWLQQQEVKRRVKRLVRSEPQSLYFNDPIWPNMWYLHCGDKQSRCRSEMNVQAAWKRGYTGKNVVVTILDDGIERNHPDLAPNYDSYASYDVNGNDYDPSPRYDASNENKHGTRCAGEVAAAANNSYCIVGIAYNAKIGGIRMLDGDVTDVVEAKSLGVRPNYIDIYSASWGPDDDGKTVDGPGRLAKQAFEYGIKKGRQGLGSIFVWASGNGGREGDYCSCDGYTNSIYTVSVSSTTENGYKPWYLEECPSTLATTYSSGAFYERKIVKGTYLGCSHLYGFGLVDAEALVLEAKKWTAVPSQHTCVAFTDKRPRSIPVVQTLRTTALTTACADHSDQRVGYLEHVVARISISHPRRGDLQIHLISPSGTKSQLLAKRVGKQPGASLPLHDHSNEGFSNWEFMTVHSWGEKAEGEWTLEIQDMPSQVRSPGRQGKLKEWSLVLYGTAEHPYHTFRGVRTGAVPRPGAAITLLICTHTARSSQGPPSVSQTSLCHPECGDKGCDGPGADQCLSCVHFSLGNAKTGSPTQCLSCRRGFFHHQETSTCVNPCPAGFYASDSQRKCLKCHPSCKKCVDDPEKCTVCKEGFSLARGSCIPDCEPGTYFDSELVRCGQCHPTCKTCVGPSREECIHCASNLHFQDWKCVPACGEGYYPEAMPGLPHRVCRRCHENCRSCEVRRKLPELRGRPHQLGALWVANHTCSNGERGLGPGTAGQRPPLPPNLTEPLFFLPSGQDFLLDGEV
ncbi:Proprotein convertase subtilisin/kexin type 6 [Myotis brandtii]|uniref:Proprotein convertase subtilisin/kexin type 6 n=1 Tax=Myotis brandtii TaxID=109478 RepID=S7N3S0_MYOBR|nr:Proprotein convertase subtilisin/kexin type 6 [Myotis brandtii]